MFAKAALLCRGADHRPAGDAGPSAAPETRFSVEGAGAIVGVDNGDQTNMETCKADHRMACYSRAQVIIQAACRPNLITLKDQSDS